MPPQQSQKLTAETLLAAPRSSPPVPNDDGTLGVYAVSTHTIGGETAREVRVMDLGGGSSLQLSADDKVHDVNWIPGSPEEVIYLRSEEKKGTQVFVANARDVSKQHYELVELDAPISNVRLKQLDGGTIAFVFTGLVGEDGRLFNDEVVEKKSTGRVFDSYNIRVWNQLYKEHLYGLWYTTLSRRNQTWTLSNTFHNVLQDTKLELVGLYDTSEATDNFAISSSGIAFIARDAANRDLRGRLDTHTYFSSLPSFHCPPPGKPVAVSLPAGVGVGESTCVRAAPDESTLGFLHAPATDVYNRRLYVARIGEYIAADALSSVPEAQDETIYEPPTSFEFAGHPRKVILQREHHGRDILAHLDLDARSDPRPVTTEGAVKAYTPLRHGKWDVLLVTSTSHIDSSLVQIIDTTSGVSKTIYSATNHGASFGLSRNMWSDLYFRGSDGLEVHAFIIRPSNFDPSRKYPWVLMPHGGPVSAWTDSWSTRWNLASWAEQGYIVICPNISGSTGFGLAFAKRINDQWGGKPYEDLLHLIGHLESLPCLDQSKGVLAGASYGAYLAGWLMGHEVITKFCCVVWHSGIFNLPSFMLQTEFPTDDAAFGNRPPFTWLNAEGLQKYNPARPELLAKWGRLAPPTLVIHSDKDYRCPVTEGLAMFAALQAQAVPSRFLTFEDECHWVLKPENSLIWYRTVWDWVRKCVNGDVKRGDKEW